MGNQLWRHPDVSLSDLHVYICLCRWAQLHTWKNLITHTHLHVSQDSKKRCISNFVVWFSFLHNKWEYLKFHSHRIKYCVVCGLEFSQLVGKVIMQSSRDRETAFCSLEPSFRSVAQLRVWPSCLILELQVVLATFSPKRECGLVRPWLTQRSW